MSSVDPSATVVVGNEFTTPQPRLKMAVAAAPAMAAPLQPRQFTPPETYVTHESIGSWPHQLLDTAHHYSIIVFALLFLLVGSTATIVGSRYWEATIAAQSQRIVEQKITVSPAAKLKTPVEVSALSAKMQTITAQSATLDLGSQTVPISPDIIKSWVKVTSQTNKNVDYLNVDTAAITSSLTKLVDSYSKAPVDQVTADHADGTPAGIIEAGADGTQLSNPASIATQAQQIAGKLLGAGGFQAMLPLKTVAFQAVTPSAFAKLLEVDVNTHRMYAYDNGQLTKTFLISAGAPETPTPLGEFKIWEKLPLQTMSGYNPNGTKYIQPNVQWVNYFDHSGDAVHGNYWRPASVFGSVNTSHGCVSLPDDQAEWVYDWAPIGTTVITHA